MGFFCVQFNTLHFSLAEKYERDAKKYWDVFYKRHQDKVSSLGCLIHAFPIGVIHVSWIEPTF